MRSRKPFTRARLSAIGFVILWAIGRHRLALSPEEEYALSGGLHGDPQTEGTMR